MTYTPVPCETIDSNNSFINTTVNGTGDMVVGTTSSLNQYSSILISMYSITSSNLNGISVYGSNLSDASDAILLYNDTYISKSKYSVSIPITTKYYSVSVSMPADSIFTLLSFFCIDKVEIDYVSPFKTLQIRDSSGSVGEVTYTPSLFLGCMLSTAPSPLLVETPSDGISYVDNSIVLGVSGASRSITTKNYLNYASGSLISIEIICNLNSTNASYVDSSIGLYNGSNGFRISSNGSGILLRYKPSLSISEVDIPMNEWNGEKVDGTGSTGFVLTVNDVNTFIIEADPTACIKYMLLYYGRKILLHTANIISTPITNLILPITATTGNMGVSAKLIIHSVNVSLSNTKVPISMPYSLGYAVGASSALTANTSSSVGAYRIISSDTSHKKIIFTSISGKLNGTPSDANFFIGIVPYNATTNTYYTGSEPTYTLVGGGSVLEACLAPITGFTPANAIVLYSALIPAAAITVSNTVLPDIFERIGGLNRTSEGCDVLLCWITIGALGTITNAKQTVTWLEYN